MNSSSDSVLTASHSVAVARGESIEDQIALGLRKPPRSVEFEPLLTADEVAKRLNVNTDWVWDHSSRRKPLLPVIRMGDGTLRYRRSGITEAHVPGHPAHDRSPGSEEGDREGRARDDAALTRGDDNRRLHAGVAGGCARHGGLHSPGAARHDEEAGGEGQDAATSRRYICGDGPLRARIFRRKSAEAWRFREETETTDMAWQHGSLKFAANLLPNVWRGVR